MKSCCCSSTCCGGTTPDSTLVPKIDSVLTRKDKLRKLAFRLGIGRVRSFALTPGLYALGDPGPEAPVLVSANCRITFDRLRADMAGRDAWVLLLDTKGVNVWCAAGKGTFGTDELVRRLKSSGLSDFVSHKNLILPQLGAPGIQAYVVNKQTGFRVHYGPVLSRDLPEYLDAGLKASSNMRRKTFTLSERMELIPLELVQSWKAMAAILAVSAVLTVFLDGSGSYTFLYNVVPALLSVLSGACIIPLLLPYIPGRAFAFKGALLGGVFAGVFIAVFTPPLSRGIFIAGIVTAASSFLAMNFTGASTFTSLSGVRKEMRYALPFQIGLTGAAVAGRILFTTIFQGVTLL